MSQSLGGPGPPGYASYGPALAAGPNLWPTAGLGPPGAEQQLGQAESAPGPNALVQLMQSQGALINAAQQAQLLQGWMLHAPSADVQHADAPTTLSAPPGLSAQPGASANSILQALQLAALAGMGSHGASSTPMLGALGFLSGRSQQLGQSGNAFNDLNTSLMALIRAQQAGQGGAASGTAIPHASLQELITQSALQQQIPALALAALHVAGMYPGAMGPIASGALAGLGLGPGTTSVARSAPSHGQASQQHGADTCPPTHQAAAPERRGVQPQLQPGTWDGVRTAGMRIRAPTGQQAAVSAVESGLVEQSQQYSQHTIAGNDECSSGSTAQQLQSRPHPHSPVSRHQGNGKVRAGGRGVHAPPIHGSRSTVAKGNPSPVVISATPSAGTARKQACNSSHPRAPARPSSGGVSARDAFRARIGPVAWAELRRTVLQQQQTFVQQLYELHKLSSVQELMCMRLAASPDLGADVDFAGARAADVLPVPPALACPPSGSKRNGSRDNTTLEAPVPDDCVQLRPNRGSSLPVKGELRAGTSKGHVQRAASFSLEPPMLSKQPAGSLDTAAMLGMGAQPQAQGVSAPRNGLASAASQQVVGNAAAGGPGSAPRLFDAAAALLSASGLALPGLLPGVGPAGPPGLPQGPLAVAGVMGPPSLAPPPLLPFPQSIHTLGGPQPPLTTAVDPHTLWFNKHCGLPAGLMGPTGVMGAPPVGALPRPGSATGGLLPDVMPAAIGGPGPVMPGPPLLPARWWQDEAATFGDVAPAPSAVQSSGAKPLAGSKRSKVTTGEVPGSKKSRSMGDLDGVLAYAHPHAGRVGRAHKARSKRGSNRLGADGRDTSGLSDDSGSSLNQDGGSVAMGSCCAGGGAGMRMRGPSTSVAGGGSAVRGRMPPPPLPTSPGTSPHAATAAPIVMAPAGVTPAATSPRRSSPTEPAVGAVARAPGPAATLAHMSVAPASSGSLSAGQDKSAEDKSAAGILLSLASGSAGVVAAAPSVVSGPPALAPAATVNAGSRLRMVSGGGDMGVPSVPHSGLGVVAALATAP